jgi:hypothetical protein
MKAIWYLVLAVGLMSVGCGSKKPTAQAQATNAPAVGDNPLTAPVDYLGAINQAHKVAVKTIDLTSVRQAIMLFHNMEERFPKDLNELVTQHYIGNIPTLPRGMKYFYNPQNGQLSVVKQ